MDTLLLCTQFVIAINMV